MFHNDLNLPLSLAVFLVSDDYDKQDGFSATTLLKSTRQILLGLRHQNEETVVPLSSLLASSIGSAIHKGIEMAWATPDKALEKLSVPSRAIKAIKENVLIEHRVSKPFMDTTINGKPDFILEGRLEDFKTTSVYSYIYQSNAQDYIRQGSIYRWLIPDVITEDHMVINYIFTDWSAANAKRDKSYPQTRFISQKYELMSLKETERFIKKKLESIENHWDTEDESLPLCTPEELWMDDPVFKYYRNPDKTDRATKNFTSMAEAQRFKREQGGVGIVKEVPGKAKACNYCPVFNFCNQGQELLRKGLL